MRMTWRVWRLAALLAAASGAAIAAPAPAPAAPAVVDLDAVLVAGRQPGPGLWQVRRGDHVLWVLGTVSPLPRRMQWESAEVEQVIAASQQVLDEPSVELHTGRGVLGNLMLLPAALKARRNPDGKTLQQTVTPAQYAAWLPLKAQYLGNDRSVEAWRPVFAAQALYEAAMRRVGLSQRSVTQAVIQRAARRGKVPIMPVVVELKIADPKAALRELRASALDDGACFARTLQVIGSDLDAMRRRANAWATGDLEALAALPGNDQYRICFDAIGEAGVARKYGLGDVRQRALEKWLASAEQALARNHSTFASLSMQTLQEPGGPLDRLRARGYEVQAP